jgi:hypothetical protein
MTTTKAGDLAAPHAGLGGSGDTARAIDARRYCSTRRSHRGAGSAASSRVEQQEADHGGGPGDRARRCRVRPDHRDDPAGTTTSASSSAM